MCAIGTKEIFIGISLEALQYIEISLRDNWEVEDWHKDVREAGTIYKY